MQPAPYSASTTRIAPIRPRNAAICACHTSFAPNAPGTVAEGLRDVLVEARLGHAVVREAADHHRHDHRRAGQRLTAAAGADSGARSTIVVALAPEHRHPREQVEVHREALAPLDPRVDAVDRHRDQRHDGVAERHDRDLLRRAGLAHGQLERREADQHDRRGPAPEPLRVGPPRVRNATRADRPPRVEGGEDVAEDHRQRHEADPERDEHDHRRDVGARALLAREPRVDDEHEDRDADRAAHDLDGARRQEPQPRDHAASGRPRASASATAPPAPGTRSRARPRRPSRTASAAAAGRRAR